MLFLKRRNDDTLMRQEQEKINQIAHKYKEFSEAAELPTKAERMSVSGYRRVSVKPPKKAVRIVDNSKNSGIIKSNKAKSFDVLNDNDLIKGDPSKQEIINELSNSKIGRETIDQLSELPESIILTHGAEPGLRGEERFGKIKIYVNQCKNIHWVARTIIHEITHWRYGIGESQWAECVCIAQELKHSRNRNHLTIAEKRRLIKAVKSDEDYKKLNWRKGGLVNGRRKNHR